jgi:hypothetical protein
MKHELNLLPLALLAALVGCSGGGDDDSTATNGTTTNGTTTNGMGGSGSTTTDGASTTGTTGSSCMATGNTTVMATDAMDYDFTSTLSFPPTPVQPDTEIFVDWSALTTDFLGHPVDVATEINSVNLMLWTMTQAELEQKLNDDTLRMSDLAVIATIYPEAGETSASIYDLTSGGMALEQEMIEPFFSIEGYPPESNTYTVMAATGEELGAGTRMIAGFKLDATSTNTMVTVDDTSTDLQYTVDLQSLESIPVPAGDPSIVLDWDGLTVNGLGQEFVKTEITKLAVARFDKTPAELEENFLDLVNYDGSVNADSLWEAQVPSGSCLSLADAVDATGGAFPGIDGDSTWMVALFCEDCQNPAPWFLSFLTPG